MNTVNNTNQEQNYWSNRYQNQMTGWDLGAPSTPLKTYIDQLENKDLKILIPGAGNAYEAAYLFENGFHNTHILDISGIPLTAFAEKHLTFPKSQLLHENFFEHQGKYDLILEQTFFCSFPLPKKIEELMLKRWPTCFGQMESWSAFGSTFR